MAVRVLIVEDDSGSALVLKSRLESSGYEVVLADSGTKAITVVREQAFGALLISDQLKRGLDAMECLRRARSTPELAVTPIIFYHQRAALPTHRAKAFDAGVCAYVVGEELETLEQELRYHLRVVGRLQELHDGLRTAHEQLRKAGDGRNGAEGAGGRDSSEHQAALRELAHSKPDGALIVDAEGLVVFADRGACDLLGARLEGRHLASLVPGSGLEAFVRDAHIEVREGCRFDLPARKGRAQRSISAVVVPLLAPQGQNSHVRKVVLLGDAHRRRLAAEALRAEDPSLQRAQQGPLIEAARRVYAPSSWLGSSRLVVELRQWLQAAMRDDAPVLIQGMSGTGKRTAARTLHYSATRTGGFFEMHCKGCTEENLDVEIFGLARNGGIAERPGLLHLAQDGTLYISEVDTLPLPVQQRLLQYLQSGSFTRRGGTRSERAEVRLIASSNADLSALCQQGRFLSELAERLAAHVIELPTLTQRLDDMELLVKSLLSQHGAQRGIHDIHEDALALLRAHSWPGNLRELEDCIRHAAEHAVDGAIALQSLPRSVRDAAERNLPRSGAGQASRQAAAEAAGASLVPMRRPEGRIEGTHTSQTGLATAGAGSPGRNREARPWDINDEDPVSLDLYEKKALLRALSEADGDKLVAAKRLKLGKSTMYRKLKRYGIP